MFQKDICVFRNKKSLYFHRVTFMLLFDFQSHKGNVQQKNDVEVTVEKEVSIP